MTSFKLPELGEDFLITGHWWLPSYSDTPVAGTLSSTGGRIRLKLLGELPGIDPNQTYTKVPLIYGAAEAKSISLADCYQTSFGFKVPGTIEQGFYPRLVYFGDYLPEDQICQFESWSSVLTHLGPWIGKEPIQESFQFGTNNKIDKISYTYEDSLEHSFRIPTECAELKFSYEISTDSEAYRSKSFKYAARLTIKPDDPKDANWFMDRLHRLNGLMSLLIGRATRSRRVYALRRPDSERRELYDVRLDHEPPKRTKDLDPHEILVPFSAVSTSLCGIVSAWFADHEKLEEPVSLLLSAAYERPLASHVRLLLLCQALESFHRNIFGGCYLTQEDYEPIRVVLTKSIPTSIEPSLKDSLRSRIRYGYQFSFLKRLNELHSWLHDSLLRQIGIDADKFTQDVKEARNYYTHWDPASSTNIPKGAVLANLVSKLSAVSHIILLKHLSVDPNSVIERMLSNRRIYLQEYQALD